MSAKLVQYVVVRKDLLKALKWPVGAVIAQACHACCAVIHLYYTDNNTQEYLKDLDNMHKIVLEVQDEQNLRDLECRLKEGGIHHKTWIEQPENYPTCIVLKPYPKDEVQKYFKKLRLYSAE
ncbi:putative peptidyl-tRNA hydrolase PTRHD1 [Bacillus rossius redtenbacheri]|uniref:putative peptidyl-tRNA hydrolase PTRHD1 n=1 Tax=Bacillus rossius redtenbacheri TaxID=93214 RepID=UPI002FDD4497